MELTVILSLLTGLAGAIASIVSGRSKLNFSKEFKEAKEERIRSANEKVQDMRELNAAILEGKNSEIESLKREHNIQIENSLSKKEVECAQELNKQNDISNGKLLTKDREIVKSESENVALQSEIKSLKLQNEEAIRNIKLQNEEKIRNINAISDIKFDSHQKEIKILKGITPAKIQEFSLSLSEEIEEYHSSLQSWGFHRK